MKDDQNFMNHALAEARCAIMEGNWPIGAVVVLNNKIIAKAHNEVFTNKCKIDHAELIALKQCQDKLLKHPNQATLYTTYEPCPMCFGACVLSKIKRVVSSLNIENSGAMYLKDHLPKLFTQDKYNIEFTHGVLAKECYKVFIQGDPVKKLIERKAVDEKLLKELDV